MTRNYTNQELINGLIHNDKSILDYLYAQVGPPVRTMILNLGGSSEEANDIFQEGIVAAFVNVRSGRYTDLSNTKFTTYLQQLCKYKWYDVMKSAHKTKSAALPDDFQLKYEESESLEQDERMRIVRSNLEKLGQRCREILNYFYWENKTMDEIATIYEMTVASVKNAKYRCMQQLKVKCKEINILD